MPGEAIPTSANVATAIKAARELAGMTQEGVAEALRARGLTTALSTYQRWEKLAGIGLVETIVLLDVVGLDADELVDLVRDARDLPPDEFWRRVRAERAGGDPPRLPDGGAGLDEAAELQDAKRGARARHPGRARRAHT